MEIEINKEIRNYNESIFFGLTLRQCIFSGMALIFSVLIYFILSPFLPIAIWSLICILAATPIAAIGFIKYNGMCAEEFIVVLIRYLFTPKHVVFVSEQKMQEYSKRKERKIENTDNNKKRR